MRFMVALCTEKYIGLIYEILEHIKHIIRKYITGLFLEMAIVAIVACLVFWVLGVKYVFLLGLLVGILNIIPYIGGLIAIAIPMMLAFAIVSPISALWVLIAYLIVQFIDNNLLVPKIVASKVEVSALVSIIVVLIGGSLWGVAGMFLSIPLTAIFKVIFDRIEGLEAFGFLIGDGQEKIKS